MKRKTWMSRLMLLLAAQLIACWSAAQTDTIFISHQATTYLLFDQQVSLVNVGHNQGYQATIEGKAVFVKASKTATTPTSIFVQHGDHYLTAVLAYKATPKQILYDYRQNDSLPVDKKAHPQIEDGFDRQTITKRLTAWDASPNGMKRRTSQKNGLTLSLTHIQNDKEATYLSFTFTNDSSIDYLTDLVTFERKEKIGKRFSKNNINSVLVEPIAATTEKARLEAKTSTKLSYAIPLYAMSARGKLIVTFREKGGSRILSCTLPASWINHAFLQQLSGQHISFFNPSAQ